MTCTAYSFFFYIDDDHFDTFYVLIFNLLQSITKKKNPKLNFIPRFQKSLTLIQMLT